MTDRAATLLNTIQSPRDLKRLPAEQLPVLAAEIRDFLIAKVARTGGHIGPNLGVVELTLAMHRVFDSPRDRFVFDTGHQAYVHKIVTGRQDGFDLLRQRGGLTGYPNQGESEHDLVENCHASTALSYADGMAKAYALRGESRHVVALVGDGSFVFGEPLAALWASQTRRAPILVVIFNNGCYNATRAPLVAAYPTGHSVTANDFVGIDLLPAPRYDLLAPVVGAHGERVDDPADVLPALRRGLQRVQAGQSVVLDVQLVHPGS